MPVSRPDAFLERVARTCRERRLIPPAARVGVAVSGGPDSTALLDALAELRPALECQLAVVHLNHRLRGEESDADAQFVEDLARRLEIPFVGETVDVRAAARAAGENLEAAGRAARYAFFERLLASGVCDSVATGHTRSDQAETVLFRLLRGAGSRGLAAVRARRQPGIVRPLIDVSRGDALAFLERRGRDWREDPSNNDPSFARNRIRGALLPALARDWNPRIERTLARLADQAAEDEAYWSEQVAAVERRLLRVEGAAASFSAAAAATLPPALLGRFLRRAAARALAGEDSALDHDSERRLRALVLDSRGAGGLSLSGLAVRRSLDRVLLTRAAASRANEAAGEPRRVEPPVELLACDRLSSLRFRLRSRRTAADEYNNENRRDLDWNRLPRPIVLRSPRAGDRLEPAYGGGLHKLRRLLQSAGVPAWERETWPVLAASDSSTADSRELLWARGFGPAARYRWTADAGEALEVREIDVRGREIRRIEEWTADVNRSRSGR